MMVNRPVCIGIIGYGAIGQQIAALNGEAAGAYRVAAVLVKPEHLTTDACQADLAFVTRLEDFLDCGLDVAIECAGAAALRDLGGAVLEAGCDLVAASAGGLVDDAVRQRLTEFASRSGSSLLVASGAVGALDALAAMRMAGLRRVVYRGVKPPAAWRGSLAEERCDLDAIAGRSLFFEGSAREAAKGFPKNANVAAIIGLAGLGLDQTRVELFADPAAAANCHEIEAEATTGSFAFRIEGQPSQGNARTSALTAYSLLHCAVTRSAAIVLR